MPGLPVHHQLPELAKTHVHQVGDAIQLSCPLPFPSAPAFNISQMSQYFTPGGQSIGVSALVSSHSNEYSGLISFRIDWLDVFAVQGTLKSLLTTPQFKSINSLALSFLYGQILTSTHDY